MKNFTIFLLFVFAVDCANAQGYLNFRNSAAALVSTNSVNGGGATGLISGAGRYYFALFTAPPTIVDPNQFTFSGVYALNGTAAGQFQGGNVSILGTAPGETINFLVRGWSANIGSTWSAVSSYLSNPTFVGSVGQSQIGQLALGGATTPPPPVVMGSNPGQVPGFTLNMYAPPPPLAPVLTVPTNQVINDLSSLTVTASAVDEDYPANRFTFTLNSPPLGMTVNPTNGAIAWMPLGTQGGRSYQIGVTATENVSPPVSVSSNFTVTVNEINTPPVLTVPQSRTYQNVASLSLTATAADADVPVETLTYSLLAGPSGMSINPSTGVINWSPTRANAFSTNVVTVAVTDNGSPPLSATNTFIIIIGNNSPVIMSTSVQNGKLNITWNAVAGKTYQLQFTSNLGAPSWSTLGAVTANGPTATLADSLGSARRFYRIEPVP